MATINEKLGVLASTTERADKALTIQDLEEQKRKNTNVDYKMVTFSLSGKDYGIDIMKVKERAKAGCFTYVPNTLPFVSGVYNLRGEIIPVIDLRVFFNIEVPAHNEAELENMLIVTVGEQTFGVVVDSIDKVVGVQKSTIQPPHPLFGDINIKYIYGVVEADSKLYVLLDIDKIFGVKSAEEEKKMAEEVKAQMKMRQEAAIEVVEQESKPVSATVKSAPAAQAEVKVAIEKKNEVDLNFIADSLLNLKKFTLNAVNEAWAKERYAEWAEERGEANTQLQNESDAEAFLRPFYSPCNAVWWNEAYAEKVKNALPQNSAKNIVVWNLGCGKGIESYSLACVLRQKYPEAKIRIYAHDVDLLSVSNAPLLTVPDDVSRDWYQPFLTKTVSGDYTFSKEIKDMIMFEYHDCVHANNLPDIDIIFARDVVSFIPETVQGTLFNEFTEKLKGNGTVILGANEVLAIPGWTKKSADGLSVYSK